MRNRVKKRLSVLLVLTIMAGLVLAGTPAKAADRGTLALGTTVSGSITEGNDYDQYTIVLTQPGKLTVRLTSRINEVQLKWINSELQEIRANNDVRYGSESSPKIYEDSMDLEAGTYYIRVNKDGSSTGTYDLVTSFSAAGNNEMEPNNTSGQAQLLSINQAVTGYISYQDDDDFYKIVLVQPGKLSVRLTSRINEVQIKWINSELQEIRTNNDVRYGSEESPKIYEDTMDLEAGTYYIRVNKDGNSTGTYDLIASFRAAGNNETEPNNTPAQAQTLSMNQTVTGYISYQDDNDYYRVVLTQPGKLSVRLTSRINEVQIKWISGELQEIRANNDVRYGSEESPKIYEDAIDMEAGTYYIRVNKDGSSTGTYDLITSFKAAGNNEIEPNNTPAQAQTLSMNQTVTGYISYQDDNDYYKVVLLKAGKLSLRLTSRINEVQLKWINSELQEMRANNDIRYGSEESPKIYEDSMDLDAGTYYIRVNKDGSSTGTYDLLVYDGNQKPPDPTGNFEKVSPWAVPEIQKAEEYGLVPDVLYGLDLTKPITRAEFAAASVKVYESFSGTLAVPAAHNPFTDTNDIEVLKAYNVGITNGISPTRFDPHALINREQAATMLTRVFKRVTMPGWTLETDSQYKLSFKMPALFPDDAKISGWARDSVYFMAANGIINGMGNGNFAPRNTTQAEEARGYANATREQALAIAVRMVENL